MLIVGLDPGGTTGCVAIRSPWQIVGIAQISEDAELIAWLNNMSPDTVIAESFKLYPWKAKSLSYSGMPAAEILGIIKLWCKENSVELVLQPAAMLKTIPDTMLRECGLWLPTRGADHARDAARHVLLWALKNWPSEINAVLEGAQ